MNEVKGQIPSITNLATTTALTTAENKIPKLVKKTDYNTKIYETEKKITDHNHDKYITTSEFKGSCLKLDKISFNHGKVVNIYIAYEINKNFNISSYPTLENCLFHAVELSKHPDIDQYKYSGYAIGFDRKGFFHLVMKLVEM